MKNSKKIVCILFTFLGVAMWAAPTASAETNVPNVKQVRVRSYKETKLRVKWKKVASADGYQIFQYKPKEKKFVRIATVGKEATSWVSRNTKTEKTYKVRAFKKVAGKKIYSKFSYEVRAIPYNRNAKKVNAGKVTPNRRNVTLGYYETETLSVTITPSKYAKNKKAVVADSKVRWYSTDKSIATVDENGKVSPQGKTGECAVYARAHNGNYSGKIWIKVKDFARPKKFYDVEYMQEDMKKLVVEHENDIKEIAAYFENNRAENNSIRQEAYFGLNDGRTDVIVDLGENMGENRIAYEPIKEVMFRVMDSFPGEMGIYVNDMAIYFMLRDERISVDLSYGFLKTKEDANYGNSDRIFKISPRWYYRCIELREY